MRFEKWFIFFENVNIETNDGLTFNNLVDIENKLKALNDKL